jgi:hypothetical protein
MFYGPMAGSFLGPNWPRAEGGEAPFCSGWWPSADKTGRLFGESPHWRTNRRCVEDLATDRIVTGQLIVSPISRWPLGMLLRTWVHHRSYHVLWFIPTSGDEHYLGSPIGRRPATFEYIRQIATAIDQLGYYGVLLPTGPACGERKSKASEVGPWVRRWPTFCLATSTGGDVSFGD